VGTHEATTSLRVLGFARGQTSQLMILPLPGGNRRVAFIVACVFCVGLFKLKNEIPNIL
jgi:hypothetical protein